MDTGHKAVQGGRRPDHGRERHGPRPPRLRQTPQEAQQAAQHKGHVHVPGAGARQGHPLRGSGGHFRPPQRPRIEDAQGRPCARAGDGGVAGRHVRVRRGVARVRGKGVRPGRGVRRQVPGVGGDGEVRAREHGQDQRGGPKGRVGRHRKGAALRGRLSRTRRKDRHRVRAAVRPPAGPHRVHGRQERAPHSAPARTGGAKVALRSHGTGPLHGGAGRRRARRGSCRSARRGRGPVRRHA